VACGLSSFDSIRESLTFFWPSAAAVRAWCWSRSVPKGSPVPSDLPLAGGLPGGGCEV